MAILRYIMLVNVVRHVEAVRLLLEAGANPNIAKTDGSTALMTTCAAAGYERNAPCGGTMKEYKECVELLSESPNFDFRANN